MIQEEPCPEEEGGRKLPSDQWAEELARRGIDDLGGGDTEILRQALELWIVDWAPRIVRYYLYGVGWRGDELAQWVEDHCSRMAELVFSNKSLPEEIPDCPREAYVWLRRLLLWRIHDWYQEEQRHQHEALPSEQVADRQGLDFSKIAARVEPELRKVEEGARRWGREHVFSRSHIFGQSYDEIVTAQHGEDLSEEDRKRLKNQLRQTNSRCRRTLLEEHEVSRQTLLGNLFKALHRLNVAETMRSELRFRLCWIAAEEGQDQ